MIDGDKLRALLDRVAPDKLDHDAWLDAETELRVAAVNALPELFAVYEAACAWRDINGETPFDEHDRKIRALADVIDAARGKR